MVEYRTDRILVQVKPGATPQALAKLHGSRGAHVLGHFGPEGRLQTVSVPPGTRVPDLISEYLRSGLVTFAEPDYVRHGAATPNDPKYTDGTLWWLNNYGQNGGVAGADIHAAAAWDISASAPDVIVAILDSGVRYTHEDLAINMWTNPVDGSHGWNALTGTNDPVDSSGHGTLAAGVIGAAANNGKGMAGIAWRVQLMACTCFDANNNGFDSDIIACMEYARTNGAKIVNASWGSYSNSLALSNAVFQLRQEGITLVAAAGNNSRNIDTSPYYPACLGFDNVISVGYSTRNDTLGTFSNYGQTNVHLIGPGAAMYSTFFASDSSYLGNAFLEGTSFSAPMVSGALALLASRHPADAPHQLIARLLRAADPVPALAGKCLTGGRLNLAKALNPPIVLKPAVSGAELTVRVKAEPGTRIVVEAGDDVSHWVPVVTNTTSAAGVFDFSETRTASPGSRFYRAVAKP